MRKDVRDTARALITFLSGIELGKYSTGVSGGKIDEEGNAELNSLVLREALKSLGFTTGALGSGYFLGKDENGDSYLEVDRMLVRKIATFVELLIQELRHVGGQIILTPASMQCARVEDHDTYYRCYFESTDGERTINQEFVTGDQARCQTFNIKEGVNENVSNTYYWRLVVGTGDNYIDLSKTDCDAGSTVPQAGDDIVQLGNRTDATRQTAIVLSSYGNDAPYIKMYRGINSYNLSGKEFFTVSRTAVNITADVFRLSTGENITEEIANIRGEVEQAKQDAAEAAQDAAAAAEQAQEMVDELDKISSDNYISPVEKTALRQQHADIDAEYDEIIADAEKYGVSATAYTGAYNQANTALNKYTAATPQYIPVSTDYNQIAAYYTARQTILDAIATAAKALADEAKEDAQQALQDAQEAMQDAQDASQIAEQATERLNQWAADGVISPTEKQSLKDEIARIDADKNEITAQYTKYDLGTPTAFNNAYNTYRAQLATMSASTPETITIPSNFATNQTAYYTQRTNALNAIADAAKQYVDDQAGSITTTVTETVLEAVQGQITAAVKTEVKNIMGGYNLCPSLPGLWEQGSVHESWENYTYDGLKMDSTTLIRTADTFNVGGLTQVAVRCNNSNYRASVLQFDEDGMSYGYDGYSGLATQQVVTLLSTTKYIAVLCGRTSGGSITPDAVLEANIKVEIGGSYTEWNEATDRGAGYDYSIPVKEIESSLTILEGEITSKVSEAQVQQMLNGYVTSSTFTSQITQLSSEINLKVSSSELPSAINSALGNYNLCPSLPSLWEQGTLRESLDGYEYEDIKQASTTRIRTKEVFGVDGISQIAVRCNGSGYMAAVLQLDGNMLTYGYDGYSSFATRQVVTLLSGTKYIAILLIRTNQGTITPASILEANVKVEIGNSYTDWKESIDRGAGYDYSTQMKEATAAIDLLNDQISLTVTKTEFNSLGDRVSTAESEIEQTAEAISMKVWTQDIYDAIEDLTGTGYNMISNSTSSWELGTFAESRPSGSTYEEVKMESTTRIRIKELVRVGDGGKIACRVNGSSDYNYAFCQFDENELYLGISTFITWASQQVVTLNSRCRYIAVLVRRSNNGTISVSEIENVKLKIEAGDEYTPWNESVDAITSALLATGIDVDAKTVTVTASNFRVQNSLGSPIAVFKTDSSGKPVLKADYIDVQNLSVQYIEGATGTFENIYGTSRSMPYGRSGEMSLTAKELTFTLENSSGNIISELHLGGITAQGANAVMNVEVNNNNMSSNIVSGIRLDVSGGRTNDTWNARTNGNHALLIEHGDIAGFRLFTRRISANFIVDGLTNIIMCTNSSTITITLPSPSNSNFDDGHMLFIRKCSTGNITLSGTIRRDFSGNVSSITIQNQSLVVVILNKQGGYWTTNSIQNGWD